MIDNALLKEIIYEKEQYWIKLYRCKKPNGYNLTDGGEGLLGYNHSEETRNKIKEKRKLQIIVRTPEWNKKIAESNRGKKHHVNPEKAENKKIMMSQKFKGENNPFFGKKHSEESRKKMSELRKGQPGRGYYSSEWKKNHRDYRKGEIYGRE